MDNTTKATEFELSFGKALSDSLNVPFPDLQDTNTAHCIKAYEAAHYFLDSKILPLNTTPLEIRWVAKGNMKKFVPNSTPGNPSDIVVVYDDGALGISLKSTKENRDICFKNFGIGRLEKLLETGLKHHNDTALNSLLYQAPYLSKVARHRKTQIRSCIETMQEVDKIGSKVLKNIRHSLFESLNTMTSRDLKTHLLEHWIQASSKINPPYVKVLSMRDTVEIQEPLSSHKTKLLQDQNTKLEFGEVGNETIAFVCNDIGIMKMRIKYTSQKLASSLKVLGEPL